MASVSVVGPAAGPGPHHEHHRAGSEPPPPLLFFKVTASGGVRKKPSAREKMMFRTNECEYCESRTSTSTTTTEQLPGGAPAPQENNQNNPWVVAAGGGSGTSPPGRGARDAAVTGGGMPGGSSTATGEWDGRRGGALSLYLPAHAPRSPASQGAEDRCVTSTTTTTAGLLGDSDCNSNCVDCCDSNLNGGGGGWETRKTSSSSPKGTVVVVANVMPSAPSGANNGHDYKAQREVTAVAPNGRQQQQHAASPAQPNGQRGAAAAAGAGARLTQGRTGVVRYARTERPRLEAWSIFPLLQDGEPDPRVRAESGEGHRFEPKLPVAQEDWCDVCSRVILARALKCRNCSYTCHLECESRVQLDCNQRDGEPRGTPSPRSHRSAGPRHKNEAKQNEVSETGTKALSEEEVRSRIEEYNAQVSENGMKLASDGSYTGFIKVHLRLSRPVTVPERDPVCGTGRPASTSEEGGPAPEGGTAVVADTSVAGDRRTSFYLPSDCVKQLHIASFTTVKEVIQGLLKKFMVLDNPRKFALYRQTHRDGQDLFQKLPLGECPLALRLVAGTDSDLLTFVLKENETTEVEWHAFSVPELQNFLVILGKEESERVHVVEHKYAVYRQKLQKALQQHNP